MDDRLTVLERRGDELEAFADCEQQANNWLRENSTDSLVEELRHARHSRRRVKLGTTNVLILLAHIDRLEELVSGAPLQKS